MIPLAENQTLKTRGGVLSKEPQVT
jgi:hypothetical protein